MKALLHFTGPGRPPVGVWWLPKHRSRPQSLYLDQSYYTLGALAVLGQSWKIGNTLSLAQWENRADRLGESANQLTLWEVHETNDPEQLLEDNLSRRQSVKRADTTSSKASKKTGAA